MKQEGDCGLNYMAGEDGRKGLYFDNIRNNG